jgi:hypothetical protein
MATVACVLLPETLLLRGEDQNGHTPKGFQKLKALFHSVCIDPGFELSNCAQCDDISDIPDLPTTPSINLSHCKDSRMLMQS